MLNLRLPELESPGEGPGHLCVENVLHEVLTCHFRAGNRTASDFQKEGHSESFPLGAGSKYSKGCFHTENSAPMVALYQKCAVLPTCHKHHMEPALGWGEEECKEEVHGAVTQSKCSVTSVKMCS